MQNKKSQVAETITLVFVTIVIIVIMLIFVFISSALHIIKSVDSGVKIGSIEDRIKEKTSFAYSLNSENKNKIEIWLKEIKWP